VVTIESKTVKPIGRRGLWYWCVIKKHCRCANTWPTCVCIAITWHMQLSC